MDQAEQAERKSGYPILGGWPLAPPILEEEVLSSWLVRAALRHSCTALALTGDLWPGWRYWCSDPDVSLSEERLSRLSVRSGISEQELRDTLLRLFIDGVRGESPGSPGCYPWILCLGSRNRRRAGGLQYCPNCFAEETPYYRRHSRLAWHTVCARHQTLLRHRCPHCEAPLCPHLLEPPASNLVRCHRCRRMLSEADALKGPRDAYCFQAFADRVLVEGHGLFGGQLLKTSEWFYLVRWITGFLRSAAMHPTSHAQNFLRELGIEIGWLIPPASGLPLEMLPPYERAQQLSICWRILQAGPNRLENAVMSAGVPPSMFAPPQGCVPTLVDDLMKLLGEPRCRALPRPAIVVPRSPSSVLKMWHRLLRKIQR